MVFNLNYTPLAGIATTWLDAHHGAPGAPARPYFSPAGRGNVSRLTSYGPSPTRKYGHALYVGMLPPEPRSTVVPSQLIKSKKCLLTSKIELRCGCANSQRGISLSKITIVCFQACIPISILASNVLRTPGCSALLGCCGTLAAALTGPILRCPLPSPAAHPPLGWHRTDSASSLRGQNSWSVGPSLSRSLAAQSSA